MWLFLAAAVYFVVVGKPSVEMAGNVTVMSGLAGFFFGSFAFYAYRGLLYAGKKLRAVAVFILKPCEKFITALWIKRYRSLEVSKVRIEPLWDV